MNIIEDLAALRQDLDQVEAIEKLTMRWVFQAMLNFGSEAYEVFHQSEDEVDDVGEDITREALDRLPSFNIPTRVYGTVDYKKARYVILPDGIVTIPSPIARLGLRWCVEVDQRIKLGLSAAAPYLISRRSRAPILLSLSRSRPAP